MIKPVGDFIVCYGKKPDKGSGLHLDIFFGHSFDNVIADRVNLLDLFKFISKGFDLQLFGCLADFLFAHARARNRRTSG